MCNRLVLHIVKDLVIGPSGSRSLAMRHDTTLQHYTIGRQLYVSK